MSPVWDRDISFLLGADMRPWDRDASWLGQRCVLFGTEMRPVSALFLTGLGQRCVLFGTEMRPVSALFLTRVSLGVEIT